MLFLFVSAMGYLLTSDAATTAVLSQLSQLVPVYKKELSEMLSQLIATRKTSGVIGTVILLFFSTQLFACLRMVMNVVFEERRGRGFFLGMLWDVVMLAVIAVLFVTSMFITELFFWLRTFILAPPTCRGSGSATCSSPSRWASIPVSTSWCTGTSPPAGCTWAPPSRAPSSRASCGRSPSRSSAGTSCPSASTTRSTAPWASSSRSPCSSTTPASSWSSGRNTRRRWRRAGEGPHPLGRRSSRVDL